MKEKVNSLANLKGFPLSTMSLLNSASWKTYLALTTLAVSSAACVKKSSEAEISSRPNILLIYTDDQSFRTLGCYADEGAWPWVNTPNIDRLAKEGVKFSNAYGASWSLPSRASLLTGLLPHGIPGMKIMENRDTILTWACRGDGYDPEIVPFWPVEMRKSGYATAMIGKWHIGQKAGHGWLWDHSVVWDQNTPTGDWYNDQMLEIDGAEPKVVPGYSTDVYTRFATEYIHRQHDKPWFLWLCYNAPHLPNTVHPRHSNFYEDADVILPSDVFGERKDKPAYMHNWTMFRKAPDGTILRRNIPLHTLIKGYNRLVSAIDDGVGELLKALEETGQLNNTLVIFTSDQGFAWGEHGFAMKTAPYDANLRMPLIFRMPEKIKKGAVCSQPVTILDISPTILNFAGISLPWDMHGHDLKNLLVEPGKLVDRPILMEYFSSKFGEETNVGITDYDKDLPYKYFLREGPDKYYGAGVPYWLFLRQGKYKYIRILVDNEIEELYDLENDPEELTNLALDPEYLPILQDFRIKMRAELKRTNAGFIDSLPPIASK